MILVGWMVLEWSGLVVYRERGVEQQKIDSGSPLCLCTFS